MDGTAQEQIDGDSATVRITWWGHSTVCVEDSGVRLLTDPVIAGRVAHLRRRRGKSPTPDDVGRPDAVLVSHLHADHLHLASLRRVVGDATTVVLPAGGVRFIRAALGTPFARRCVELCVGEEIGIGAVRVRAAPAAHDGRRGPWSRHRADAIGYTLHGAATTWFAGDTGLFSGMADLGPLDLALVPVGGWGPTLGHGHLDSALAAEAVRLAAAACAVPVHFGTFWPIGFDRVRPDRFSSPGEEFAGLAATVAPDTRVEVLAPGQSFAYARMGAR
ncbi:MAG TPA: MBL fold metallo-hydrolase [Pilimelia sp.]|nr:MBL fold metallo-hydrolase [Pilimelia sp.]